MTALRVKTIEPGSRLTITPPEPAKPVERSTLEYVRKEGDVPWSEVQSGERGGKSVAGVCFRGFEQRDMNLGNLTEGGVLGASRQPRAVNVIEYLRAVTIARRLGVRFPDVKAEDFSLVPKVALGAGLTFVGEGGAPAEQSLAFGAIVPELHTGIAWCDVSHALWKITGGVADEILARDLFGAAAAGVDRVVFGGDGLIEPQGIIGTPLVDSRSGAAFSISTAAAMLKVVEDGNGENIAWAMDPATAEKLRTRAKVSGGERMIFENGTVLDKPALVSNSVPAGHLIAGDFSKAACMVRDVELLVDRSSRSTAGAKRLLVFVYLDVVITQRGCFSIAEAVS